MIKNILFAVLISLTFSSWDNPMNPQGQAAASLRRQEALLEQQAKADERIADALEKLTRK